MHVMITIDGSEAALDAAEVAVGMYGTGADYSIVSVGAPIPVDAITPLGVQPALLTVTRADGEPLVDVTAAPERHVEEAALVIDVAEAETVVAVGPPGPEICRLAAERHADVIVLGAHDRGWLSRLVEPSVARHVVEHAPCHVLVVRNEPDSGPAAIEEQDGDAS